MAETDDARKHPVVPAELNAIEGLTCASCAFLNQSRSLRDSSCHLRDGRVLPSTVACESHMLEGGDGRKLVALAPKLVSDHLEVLADAIEQEVGLRAAAILRAFVRQGVKWHSTLAELPPPRNVESVNVEHLLNRLDPTDPERSIRTSPYLKPGQMFLIAPPGMQFHNLKPPLFQEPTDGHEEATP